MSFIVPGLTAQVVFRIKNPGGGVGPEISRLAEFVGHTGRTVHFRDFDVDEEDLIDVWFPLS